MGGSQDIIFSPENSISSFVCFDTGSLFKCGADEEEQGQSVEEIHRVKTLRTVHQLEDHETIKLKN